MVTLQIIGQLPQPVFTAGNKNEVQSVFSEAPGRLTAVIFLAASPALGADPPELADEFQAAAHSFRGCAMVNPDDARGDLLTLGSFFGNLRQEAAFAAGVCAAQTLI